MANQISRLFIANRGEICRRIAQAAQLESIEVVAICGASGPPPLLLDLVDTFIPVEREDTALYLDGPRLITMAHEQRCDAIHPGFGFLSENAGFAQLCEKEGMTWVGPEPMAIEKMANKARALEIAQAAQVPCLPGLSDLDPPQDLEGDFSQLDQFVAKAGLPIIIKAVLGGGGKGMRVVRTPDEVHEAALRCASEAQSSFGDRRLICEKYLEAPRHVEVQVFGDHRGKVIALGDRDCSLQRRHQKVIEEAPAPGLSQETRQAMHNAACALASSVDYRNAGTVEFLLDSNDPTKFYFLEMNTRLQVEHPVTEEVFGIDLVRMQLQTAQGKDWGGEFAGSPRGHALELRLYAEDPEQNFMPQPGDVAIFRPAPGKGIRWELGVESGSQIDPQFDPMVAKLVVYASDRSAALRLADQALEQSFFAGPKNNFQLLQALLRHPEFKKGPVSTHFLAREREALIAQRDPADRTEGLELLRRLQQGGSLDTPKRGVDDVVAHAFHANPVGTGSPDNLQAIDFKTIAGRGQTITHLRGRVDETPFEFAALKSGDMIRYWLQYRGQRFRHEESRDDGCTSDAQNNPGDITPPVPGKIVDIRIRAGETVKKSQTLFVLESMKMEFEVKAPRDGIVSSITVATGEQVNPSQKLVEWGPDEA